MTVNPITLAVVRGRFEVIAEEMQFTMIRSAYSNIVKEAADTSAALFTREGELISQASGIPILLGVLMPAVSRMIEVFPPRLMQEGDAFVLNDPYEGGTHLPDFVVLVPVFLKEKLIGFTSMITHHQDVGGKTPGSIPTDAKEIFEEGIRIPPIRLRSKGVLNETLIALLHKNVRYPDELIGDLEAQIGACDVGASRLKGLFAEYGTETVPLHITELLQQSEKLTRHHLSLLKPGVYKFVDQLDNDGIDLDRRIPIAVTVTVGGDSLKIDFTGTSNQVHGPFNATPPSVMAAACFVIRALTDKNIPNNAGCYRALALILPEGSLVNPRPPASVNARSMTFCLIVDAILGALASAAPDKVPAASYEYPVVSFSGWNSASRQSFVFYEIGTGGYGARPYKDGVDVFRSKAGNTLNSPVEVIELNYPVRVLNYSIRPDSGGAGRYRGGNGYSKTFMAIEGPIVVSHRGDRHYAGPWGLNGGKSGARSQSKITRRTGESTHVPSKQVFVLSEGDCLEIESAGGGGYGDPASRDPSAVLNDWINGKLSLDAARSDYRVEIRPADRTIDEAKTAELRAVRVPAMEAETSKA